MIDDSHVDVYIKQQHIGTQSMTVSLRKAHAFSQALITAGQKINLSPTVDVSVYDENVATTIDIARESLAERVERADTLILLGYEIRDVIRGMNASNGVDGLLTRKAALDAVEKALTGLQTAGSGDVVRTVGLQIQAGRKRLEDHGYASETVSANVVTPEIAQSVARRLTAIRREKVEIGDQLLAINLNSKIALSSDAETALRSLGLI